MPDDNAATPVSAMPEETTHTDAPALPPVSATPKRRWKIPEAFWKFATVFSFVVNFVLIIVLLLVAGLVFQIKQAIAKPLIGGLHTSFVDMDQAHITTSILVSDTLLVKDSMPVVFDLPLQQNTTVTLVKDTPVQNAVIYLNNQPVPLNLILRQGTELGISLSLTVPVSQTIPVALSVPVMMHVPVDIPLSQTELHSPFTHLAGLVGPYDQLLDKLPSSWKELFGSK
jgi:hypothetical protein